jgi:hypothetical protein
VLQVLGLTYQNLRGAGRGVGRQDRLQHRKGGHVVKTLVTEGLGGAWKQIVE